MKQWIALSLGLIVLLAGCAKLTPEQEDFQQVCTDHFGAMAWMKMSPMQDGKMEGMPCWGCMPDSKTHVCSKAELERWIAGFGELE
jgi:hypothetical protein